MRMLNFENRVLGLCLDQLHHANSDKSDTDLNAHQYERANPIIVSAWWCYLTWRIEWL